jgi:GNAT superfamily N-acetyltransferase
MGEASDRYAVRPFEAPDGAFCHKLRREAFLKVFSLELTADQVRAGADAFDVDEFGKIIGALDSFVVWDGSRRVGFCTIRYPNEQKAELLYVYVHLGHLGEGIGSLLVRHAERWIRQQRPKVTTIVLDTAVPRYNQAFYENLGYAEHSRTVCRYPAGQVAAVRLAKTVGKE